MPKKTLLKLQAASDNLWAMQPGAFSAFMEMLQMEAKSLAQPLAASLPYGCGMPLAGAFDEAQEADPYQLKEGVALIPVDGVILRQQFWGFGAGLAETSSALAEALADPQVRALLFCVCSPGGQARGVKELADAIFAARALKPCAAWVDGLCCSAAYWLAAATGRIYAGPSSEVGSIGVILRHMDKSGLNKEMGLNFTYITAGSHKAIGNPDAALSEKDLAVLQARVDALYEMFCGDVAQHMGLALENRLAWADGRDFLAGEAASLGLITSLVANREEAIRNLLKETFMDKTELAQKHPDLLASIEADVKQSALQEAAKKTEAAVNEAVANTLAIMETACGKEATDKVRSLVATGMTPAQLEAAARAFGSTATMNSTPSGTGTETQKQMLEAIKNATPGAVSANAPASDEASAFIARVGAMQGDNMQNLASYTRPAFLGDHPPVLARMIMDSNGTENTYLAGSVLGRDSDGKLGLWTSESADVTGILAGDVTVPASGGASVDVYIHANVVADALLFADGVSADDEKSCLVALRLKGIYSSVTWAAPRETPPNDQEKTPPDDEDENSSLQGGE